MADNTQLSFDITLDPSGSKDHHILAECEKTGEPYIIFRAQDIFTPGVITAYLDLIEKLAPLDHEFIEALIARRDEIHIWQISHRARVRYPD